MLANEMSTDFTRNLTVSKKNAALAVVASATYNRMGISLSKKSLYGKGPMLVNALTIIVLKTSVNASPDESHSPRQLIIAAIPPTVLVSKKARRRNSPHSLSLRLRLIH